VCEIGDSDEDVESGRDEHAPKINKFRLTEIKHELRRMELMKETVKMRWRVDGGPRVHRPRGAPR
jgi:hypothetical protein